MVLRAKEAREERISRCMLSKDPRGKLPSLKCAEKNYGKNATTKKCFFPVNLRSRSSRFARQPLDGVEGLEHKLLKQNKNKRIVVDDKRNV